MRQVSARVKRLGQEKALAAPDELTYIASLENACLNAGLSPWKPELPKRQRAWRYFFASSAFVSWVEVDLQKIALVAPLSDQTPQEQLEGELFGFCVGYTLRHEDDFRWLEPKGSHVWELKTPDLRVFGWFVGRNYFVAHTAYEKEALKNWADYQTPIDEVIAFRSSVTEFLPDYIQGGYRDVVSDRS